MQRLPLFARVGVLIVFFSTILCLTYGCNSPNKPIVEKPNITGYIFADTVNSLAAVVTFESTNHMAFYGTPDAIGNYSRIDSVDFFVSDSTTQLIARARLGGADSAVDVEYFTVDSENYQTNYIKGEMTSQSVNHDSKRYEEETSAEFIASSQSADCGQVFVYCSDNGSPIDASIGAWYEPLEVPSIILPLKTKKQATGVYSYCIPLLPVHIDEESSESCSLILSTIKKICKSCRRSGLCKEPRLKSVCNVITGVPELVFCDAMSVVKYGSRSTGGLLVIHDRDTRNRYPTSVNPMQLSPISISISRELPGAFVFSHNETTQLKQTGGMLLSANAVVQNLPIGSKILIEVFRSDFIGVGDPEYQSFERDLRVTTPNRVAQTFPVRTCDGYRVVYSILLDCAADDEIQVGESIIGTNVSGQINGSVEIVKGGGGGFTADGHIAFDDHGNQLSSPSSVWVANAAAEDNYNTGFLRVYSAFGDPSARGTLSCEGTGLITARVQRVRGVERVGFWNEWDNYERKGFEGWITMEFHDGDADAISVSFEPDWDAIDPDDSDLDYVQPIEGEVARFIFESGGIEITLKP